MRQMKLALVQMAGAPVGDYRRTAERLEALIQQACQQGADLVLLPECAYPAYMLGNDGAAMAAANAMAAAVVQRVSELARRNQTYIVLGLALQRDGGLFNAALVFDRTGREIAFGAKSNLWHFDAKWFTPGPPAAIFNTEFGRLGLMVCADGRMPELAALLRLQGAELILDPVNLVAAAATPSQFTNQQYAFMLQVRARENGVFIAACDKCGVEADVVTFLGRSFVIAPSGRILAEASPDREEILSCVIDLDECRPVLPRRPALFQAIAQPTGSLPVQQAMTGPFALDELTLYTLVARFPYGDAGMYAAEASRFIHSGAIVSARLVILPELRQPHVLDQALLRDIQESMAPDQFVILAGSTPVSDEKAPPTDAAEPSAKAMPLSASKSGPSWHRRALVISRETCLGELDATHVPNSVPGAEIAVIQVTPSIRVAALFDAEVEIPEIARTAMLKGADLLVCFDDGSDEWRLRMMQSRAAENRIFVIRSASGGNNDCSLIFSPDAAVVTTTLAAPVHASAGLINTALSKLKDVVPGTHVVNSRNPEWYRPLTE